MRCILSLTAMMLGLVMGPAGCTGRHAGPIDSMGEAEPLSYVDRLAATEAAIPADVKIARQRKIARQSSKDTDQTDGDSARQIARSDQRAARMARRKERVNARERTQAEAIAAAEEDDEPIRPARRARKHGQKVSEGAEHYIGRSKLYADGEKYRYDCSGFVLAAHAQAGQVMSGNSRMLYEMADEAGVLHKKKNPFPGDVVFFDNTYDRNKNGRRDDKLTHVGVVETVAEDGTISVIHLGSRGVVRITMNLKHPHDKVHPDSGARINSTLRSRHGRDGGPVLTAELFRGFGSIWRLEESEPDRVADL